MPSSSGPVHEFDVAIAGGGPVGLTLALALARRGLQAAVVDAGRRTPATDRRAFFVAFGCWRIWRALGLEDELLAHAEPVLSVEAKGRGGGVSFLAEDCESETALGYMIEQGPLVAALEAAAKPDRRIELVRAKAAGAGFGDPRASLELETGAIKAALVVGCDGAGSMVRQAAGIRFEGWDYPARAISATVQLSKPHNGSARQIFLPSGPMAALPLQGDRANLVWTERAPVADALMAMDDARFIAELRKLAGGFLPGVALDGPRFSFPLGLHLAQRFHGPRVALAGDAAHQIHPLAGQGLNLGLKDVAALVDVLVEAAHVGLDIGADASLAPYTQWRRADVAISAAAMEGFARIFSGPAPVRRAAAWAMGRVGELKPARRLLAKEAGGVLGELPSLMRA